MVEQVAQFGVSGALVGILSQPSSSVVSPVAYLLFNAGVVSRRGPHRLNVRLARALAEAGHTSLRFDLSGQGDSRSATQPNDFVAQSVRDLRSAMDHVQQRCGIHHFALIGICSGAVCVLPAGLADTRVAALMMFDGHWYRTFWTPWMRHLTWWQAMGWSDVRVSVQRRVAHVVSVLLRRPRADRPERFSSSVNPPRDEFARSLQTLVDRRVALYFVYSVAAVDCYSYADQFGHVFGREPFFAQVRCEMRLDIDHSFASLEAQRRMVRLVLDWAPQVLAACTQRA